MPVIMEGMEGEKQMVSGTAPHDPIKETVMIELTEQQRQELEKPEPVAIDPQTRQTYVLVRKAVYERLKTLLAVDDYDPDEGAASINEVMAEDDAGDPLLESYQHYGRQA
jgi:hypothetical protein